MTQPATGSAAQTQPPTTGPAQPGQQSSDQPPAGQSSTGPERPGDIAEDVWGALGDPGKQAIVREREARQAAERALAAARARPAPPAQSGAPSATTPPVEKKGDNKAEQPDLAALVQQAVAAAVKPLTDAQQQVAVDQAAARITGAVEAAAKAVLHDPTDALAHLDLTSVTDGNGGPDEAKIKTALDDLTKRKPHLARNTRRVAPEGAGGSGPAAGSTEDQVKAALARMQSATGIKLKQQ